MGISGIQGRSKHIGNRNRSAAGAMPMPASRDPTTRRVRPPLVPWLFAWIGAVASFPVALARGVLAWHAIGYVLGAYATFFSVGVFRRLDARRRQSMWYAPSRFMQRTATLTLLVGFAGAAANAWQAADHLAR